MAQRFRLHILTQESEVLNRDVVSVILPGVGGYFGILAHHAPLVAALGKGTIRVKTKEGSDEELRYVVEGGFAEVSDNVLTVLADKLTVEAE